MFWDKFYDSKSGSLTWMDTYEKYKVGFFLSNFKILGSENAAN